MNLSHKNTLISLFQLQLLLHSCVKLCDIAI